MTYTEVLQYLYDKLPMFHRIGDQAYKKDLTNTLELCRLLDNPHLKLKVIHIAGTNGKGSTSHLVASMLQSMGYRVGLYTSPHYIDFRERIKINGAFIEKQVIIDFVRKYQHEIERIQPSFFEVTVALAFDYFVKKQVDFAVIEVGLGGRLDSTNVVYPLISVITNIGWDHMQFLGNTLPAIASEKAGIMKDRVPVVIGEPTEIIRPVFEAKAKEMNAPIYYAGEHVHINTIDQNGADRKVVWLDPYTQVSKTFHIPFAADYQLSNVKTAICAILKLNTYFPLQKFSLDNIIQGIQHVHKQTYFIGRWMLMQYNPTIIFDSAHNEHGLKPVFNQLLRNTQFKQLHIVFGTVADKEIDRIVELLPIDARYYFVAANIPRAMSSIALQEKMLPFKRQGNAYQTVESGYNAALENAQKSDLILVIGSIFVIGELLSTFNEFKNAN